MKKIVISMLSLFVLLFGVPISFADELVQNESDLTEYYIQVDLNDEEKSLTAKQTIIFTNNYEEPLDQLIFHLYADSYNQVETLPSIGGFGANQPLSESQIGDIKITDVQVNQQKVEYTDKEQLLKVNLADPLKTNEKVEINIEFTLKIPEGTHRLGYFQNVISLTNWYPIMSIYDESKKEWDLNPYHPIGESNYSDVANYQLEVTVPEGMEIASTGVIKNDQQQIENKELEEKIIKIEADKVRDFVMILSNDFKVVHKEIDGVNINTFYFSENKQTAQILLDEVAETVQFMNQTVGKYPYEELDIVETYLGGGAMEYPQLLQMGSFFPIELNYKESSRVPFLLEAAVHETIHQWWYVSVGNNEFFEPILDESLTVFSTAYYFEKEYGQYHSNGIISSIRSRVYPENTLPFNSSVEKFSNWGEYGNVIYGRAPIIFEDLRNKVGEEKLQQILQTYYQRFLFKNAAVQDFLDIVGEVTDLKTKEYISTSIADSNYFPQHLQLTEEEFKIMRREMLKNELKERKVKDQQNLASFLLNVLEENKVYLIKPNVTDDKERANIDQLIETLKMEFEGNMGIELIILDDTRLTNEILKKNYIVLGNPKNNRIMAEINDSMPMYLTSKGVIFDDIFIKTSSYNGYFVAENPGNDKQQILSIFWNDGEKLPYRFNFMWDNDLQFYLQVKERMEIKGYF